MMRLLRKHRQWLMIVIAILAIPFVFYFVQRPDYGAALHGDQVARIYDRNVSSPEIARGGRMLDLAMALGMDHFAQTMAAGADTRDSANKLFTFDLIIVRHEAQRLGIKPTTSEIADYVRNLRAFRGPSGFDQKKFEDFSQNALSPYGMSEAQIEELVTAELCLNRIKQLVATGVSLPENESKAEYDRAYGKFFASVIRLSPSEFTKDIKLSDEDVAKYYETHKATLKTEEKRKVELVKLSLDEAQRKLTGKEGIDALQKLADRAEQFSQALLEKGADFHQAAAKFQLPVETTGDFTNGAPDPKLKSDPQLGPAAFQLSKQEPTSDTIQGPNGFFVLHLAGIIEARPLTLEEAKPKIVEAIKATRAREMVASKGSAVAHELQQGLKSGTAVSSLLGKLNVKADKVEPFTLMDDPAEEDAATKQKTRPPDFVGIKNVAAMMQSGEVSEFFPSEQGGIVVVLEKKEPPDQAKYQEKKAAFATRILDNKKEIVFFDWLQERQSEAGLQMGKS